MTTDQHKKELYKNYIKEGLANLRDQDLLKVRLSEIKSAVKESGFDAKEFALDLKTAQDKEKAEAQIEALQISLESIESLKL
jgi:uncharacterized protein YdaT